MKPAKIALALALSAFAFTTGAHAQAMEKVRLALPTKTYWSTVAAVAAQRKGLFKKEGVDAEITIYRGSGDAFQALAANAGDFVLGAPTLAAAGRARGANAVVVALGNALPLGWHLVAKRDSTARTVKDLDGKKVGITGSGSVSDLLARYAAQQDKIKLDLIPLGGGVVPNLRAGNVDAIILWSTLSYQLLHSGEVKSLSDFAATMSPTAFDTWIASEKLVKEKPAVVQKTLNALFGAVSARYRRAWLPWNMSAPFSSCPGTAL